MFQLSGLHDERFRSERHAVERFPSQLPGPGATTRDTAGNATIAGKRDVVRRLALVKFPEP